MHLPRAASASVVALAIVVGAMGFSIATSPVAQAAPTPINITSGSCPSVIKQGQKSGCVVDLQNKLNAKGYSPGTPDGDFGPNTLSAVKAFQKGVGLDPDGLVGSNTKAALNNTKQYSVTFNNNGVSTDAVKTITKSYGTKITLPSASSTAAKAFKGWCVDKSPCPSSHAGGSTYVVTRNVTMFAQWATKTYTVTFDMNGGPGGGPNPLTKPYGTVIPVPGMINISGTGVTFKGWCLGAASCARPLREGDSLTVNGNLKLYAQWTFTNLRVSYNLNGGTGSTPNGEQRLYGAVITLPNLVGYSDASQTFRGWCEGATSCSKPLAGGSKYTIKTDKTLYAQWETPTYTVSFDLNGGPGTAPKTLPKLPNGSKFGLPEMTPPAGSGVTFLGWCSGHTSCVTIARAGGAMTVVGDMHMYAQWSFTNLRVSYNLNGGPGTTPQGDQRLWGTVITLRMMDSDAYHTFRGWCEGPTACAKPLAGKSSYTLVKDVTFYAQWDKPSYTVTFDTGGFAAVPQAQTKPYGTTITLPTVGAPSKLFWGWCVDAASCSSPLSAGSPYVVEKNVTLRAVWSVGPPSASVSLSPGNPVLVAQGSPVGITATVKPAGTAACQFAWKVADSGVAKLSSPTPPTNTNSVVGVTAGSTTLTVTCGSPADVASAAIPIKVVNAVTFDTNGGGKAPATQMVDSKGSITLPSLVNPDGRALLGWCEGTASCAKADLLDGKAAYTPSRSVTLIAQWAPLGQVPVGGGKTVTAPTVEYTGARDTHPDTGSNVVASYVYYSRSHVRYQAQHPGKDNPLIQWTHGVLEGDDGGCESLHEDGNDIGFIICGMFDLILALSVDSSDSMNAQAAAANECIVRSTYTDGEVTWARYNGPKCQD